jgi:hypothetical protein
MTFTSDIFKPDHEADQNHTGSFHSIEASARIMKLCSAFPKPDHPCQEPDKRAFNCIWKKTGYGLY